MNERKRLLRDVHEKVLPLLIGRLRDGESTDAETVVSLRRIERENPGLLGASLSELPGIDPARVSARRLLSEAMGVTFSESLTPDQAEGAALLTRPGAEIVEAIQAARPELGDLKEAFRSSQDEAFRSRKLRLLARISHPFPTGVESSRIPRSLPQPRAT